jgi:hypothetical protein
MTVFRWIIGVLSAFLVLGATFGFFLFIAFDSQLWLQRARTFRHLLWVLLLFWFNIEVWGKVVYTIWTWK